MRECADIHRSCFISIIDSLPSSPKMARGITRKYLVVQKNCGRRIGTECVAGQREQRVPARRNARVFIDRMRPAAGWSIVALPSASNEAYRKY